ncbi:MAG: BspA family leucine-rich repeat surface protein [Lachnospiraceae bacterium]|nr:BspA family leucine-rich repeat surface protein [Lachnospiraceae bacterium]
MKNRNRIIAMLLSSVLVLTSAVPIWANEVAETTVEAQAEAVADENDPLVGIGQATEDASLIDVDAEGASQDEIIIGQADGEEALQQDGDSIWLDAGQVLEEMLGDAETAERITKDFDALTEADALEDPEGIVSDEDLLYEDVVGDGLEEGDYTIEINQTDGGTISTPVSAANEGTRIAFDVKPDAGKLLSGIKIQAVSGGTLRAGYSNGKYQITMPADSVTVTPQWIDEDAVMLVVGDDVTAAVVSEEDGRALLFDSFNGNDSDDSNIIGVLDRGWAKRLGVYGIDAKTDITSIGFISDSGALRFPEDSNGLFSGLENVREIDLGKADTTGVRDMSFMFSDDKNLASLDLSGFETEDVTNMSGMFFNCRSLSELSLLGMNTANVTDMSGMFCYCESLTELDLSGFDTKNVTNMGWMFDYCLGLENLDLSAFNTENVTVTSCMFYMCPSLEEIDLKNFNTANVTVMRAMFYQCENLQKVDLTSFDTANVTDISWIFYGCKSLPELDLSSFDTTNVATNGEELSGCVALETLWTPKENAYEMDLPYAMYHGIDEYTATPVLSESIKLTKESAPLPVIIVQPENVVAAVGSAIRISTVAEGDGLTYLWETRKGQADWKESGLAGSKTPMISFKLAARHNKRQYRCTVTDAYGRDVYTDIVTLTVVDGPAITSHPKDVTADVGKIVSFSIKATGEGLTYQWQYLNPGKTKWVNSTRSGNKTSKISLMATESRNGRKYRCVVTDEAGNVAISYPAALTVN